MENIDNLLERYFNAELTSEEETMLKSYLKENNSNPEYDIYKTIFQGFEEEKRRQAPKTFISGKVTDKARKNRHTIGMITGIAASIILLFVLSIFHFQENKNADYIVILNGKKITNQEKAKKYAQNMFGEAEKIIENSHQPLCDIVNIKDELDAKRIIEEAKQQIKSIESKQAQ